MKKRYEAPAITTIGSIQELTLSHIDKCGGSGDQFLPQLLSPNFSSNCP